MGSVVPQGALPMPGDILRQLGEVVHPVGGGTGCSSASSGAQDRIIRLHVSRAGWKRPSSRATCPLGTEGLQELWADFIMWLPLLATVLKCCWLNYPEIPQDLRLPHRSLPARRCLQEWHYSVWCPSHTPITQVQTPSELQDDLELSAQGPAPHNGLALPSSACKDFGGGGVANATIDSIGKTSLSTIKRYISK